MNSFIKLITLLVLHSMVIGCAVLVSYVTNVEYFKAWVFTVGCLFLNCYWLKESK